MLDMVKTVSSHIFLHQICTKMFENIAKNKQQHSANVALENKVAAFVFLFFGNAEGHLVLSFGSCFK